LDYIIKMERKKKEMVMKKREMTMGKYVVYLVLAIGAVSGLVFLLGCDKEGIEGKKGEQVEVLFTLSGGGFVDDGEVRNGGKDAFAKGVGKEIAREFVPIGDGFYMEASLRDEGGELRATSAPAEGQLFWFVAYDENDTSTPVAAAKYVYDEGTGKLVPAVVGQTVKVTLGGKFYFAVYSYTKGDLFVVPEPPEEPTEESPALRGYTYTDYPDKDDIDPSYDLVHGRTDLAVTISFEHQEVSITMKHLAPRVKLKIVTSGVATDLIDVSGISIVGSKKSTLDVFGGTLTATGEDATVDVKPNEEYEGEGSWEGSGPSLWSIRGYVVYPTVTSVTIGELKVKNNSEAERTFENLIAKFRRDLLPGHSYTLMMELKYTRWAGSNVYDTDGAKGLEFVQAGDRSMEGIQGVFFKWGSLEGIRYNPAGYSQNEWNEIPYVSNAPASDDPANKYLTALGGTQYGSYKGDICQYIGETYEGGGAASMQGYRLPTAEELGMISEEQVAWASTNPTTTVVAGRWMKGIDPFVPYTRTDYNPYGMSDVSASGGAFTTYYNGYFPAGGAYAFNSGSVSFAPAGFLGGYWSGSAGSSSGFGRFLAFSDDGVEFGEDNAHNALSVRCIKKLAGE
jgi:hypothetical protein